MKNIFLILCSVFIFASCGSTKSIKNTGEVLAWVGGRDFRYAQYDHVKSTRQVGSVFKPIVYVTAVDQGVNICNYFKNDHRSYSDFDDW